MADMTVIQLAKVVGIPVERLLNQLKEAGLSINNEQETVNEDQKRILLNYLKGGASTASAIAPDRITLRRKSISQVKLGHDVHTGKTVNIEVRKKKTYEKHTTIPEQPIEPEIEEPVDEPEVLEVPEVILPEAVADSEVLTDDSSDAVETVATIDNAEEPVTDVIEPISTETTPETFVEETKPEKAHKKKTVVKEGGEEVATDFKKGKKKENISHLLVTIEITILLLVNVASLKNAKVMKNQRNILKPKSL